MTHADKETPYEITYSEAPPALSRTPLGVKRRKYPLDKMPPPMERDGETVYSSFVTKPDEKGVIGAAWAYSAKMREKGVTVRFSVRHQQDGSYRVWRIA